MDSSKPNSERELTSTMGNVLSVSIKDEKNDTSGSDATPTSSTDANTTTTAPQIVSDDPISSTSSDVIELNKSKTVDGNKHGLKEVSETVMETPEKSSVDPETDLLEMSISSVSHEKITEDVEDLVHDLESLLGESTDSFNIPIKRKEEPKLLGEKSDAEKDQTLAEENILPLEKVAPDSDTNLTQVKESSKSLREELIDTSIDTDRDENVVCKVTKIEANEYITEIIPSDVVKELCITKSNIATSDCLSDASVKTSGSIDLLANIGDFSVTKANEKLDNDDNIIENLENVNAAQSALIEKELLKEKVHENDEALTDEANDHLQDREGTLASIETQKCQLITTETSNDLNNPENELVKERDVICADENIVRDTKTDAGESIEHKEENSHNKKLDLSDSEKIHDDSHQVVETSDKSESNIELENIGDIENLSENNTVEEVVQEIGCQEVENDLVCEAVTQSVGSDYLQPEGGEETQNESESQNSEGESDLPNIRDEDKIEDNIQAANIQDEGTGQRVQEIDIQKRLDESDSQKTKGENSRVDTKQNIQVDEAEKIQDESNILKMEERDVKIVNVSEEVASSSTPAVTNSSESTVIEILENTVDEQPGNIELPEEPEMEASESPRNIPSETVTKQQIEEVEIEEVTIQEVLTESEEIKYTIDEPKSKPEVSKSTIDENVEVGTGSSQSPKIDEVDVITESSGEDVTLTEETKDMECEDIQICEVEADDVVEPNTDTVEYIVESPTAPETTVTEIVASVDDNVMSPPSDFSVQHQSDIKDCSSKPLDSSNDVPPSEELSVASVDEPEICESPVDLNPPTELESEEKHIEVVTESENFHKIVGEAHQSTVVPEKIVDTIEEIANIENIIEGTESEALVEEEVQITQEEAVSTNDFVENVVDTTQAEEIVEATQSQNVSGDIGVAVSPEAPQVGEIIEATQSADFPENDAMAVSPEALQEGVIIEATGPADFPEDDAVAVSLEAGLEKVEPSQSEDLTEKVVEALQSQVSSEMVPDSSEVSEIGTKSLKEDVIEISTSSQPLVISETEVEEISNVHKSSNETLENVQPEKQICPKIPEPLEQESNAECGLGEDTSDSINETSEMTSIKIKSVYDELSNEVIQSTDSPLIDDDVENSESQNDDIGTVETVPVEEDKQPNFEWVGDVISNEHQEEENSNEAHQSEKTEPVDNKVIEISDDDSKSMPVETGAHPFFSSCADSEDSEDTVPTLVLEPDEVTPSPQQSNAEQEEMEELSLAVDSTNETDIPDKLPEIEEILKDQENVGDAVENIDMQENLETILAVASLQNSAEESATINNPQISDKERKEMEALRKAVESITETCSSGYEEANDMIDITEIVLPNQSEAVSTLIQSPHSALKEEIQVDQGEAGELKEQMDNLVTKPLQHQTKVNVEDSAKNCLSMNSSKGNESSSIEVLKQNSQINKETVQILPDTSEDKIKLPTIEDAMEVLPDSSQGILASDETKLTEFYKERESNKNKSNERPKRHKKSSVDNKLEELSINVDVPEREKPYSPKITIKPIKVPDEEVSTTSNSDLEVGKGSLKMTITKQFDKMHSVLKICESENSEFVQEQDEPIPKLIIKPKMQQVEQQHSPKMSTRSSKQMYSPTSSTQRSGSPRITIKPVIKPDKIESVTPLKIKIKPEEGSKRHSPKLNIKPVTKPEEECRENIQSPRKVTIKPVIKPSEDLEQLPSPRITIKPIPKPESDKDVVCITPRLNIKPIKKQDDDDLDTDRERCNPKITIKPVIKPHESDTQVVDADEEVKKRIVLKINKGNLPTPTKESKKREHPPEDEKSEKLAKITVKFSKGGGHPHIVQQSDESNKRIHEEQSPEKSKKQKTDPESQLLTRSKHKDITVEHFAGELSKGKQREADLHIETRSKHSHSFGEISIEPKRIKLRDIPETSKLRESLMESPMSRTYNDNDDVRIIETKINSPIVISEDSRSQDSGSCIIIEDMKDPLENSPVYEIPKSIADLSPAVSVNLDSTSSTPSAPTTPTPRKRGRPRKVPIVVREEFKDQQELPITDPLKQEEPQQLHESGRPKRSCRGQSARATLGIKPRKPRGPGRGRGSKRGTGTRVVPMKPEGELRLNKAKLKLIQEGLKIELSRGNEVVEKDRKNFEEPQVIEDEIRGPVPILIESTEEPSLSLQDPLGQERVASPPSVHETSPKPTSSLLTPEVADSSGIPSATPSTSRADSVEIVMVDEETRMSADTNSRAQTPAKQVVPVDAVIEESQSSVQSTATTESGKVASSRPNKAPRLEVQEPEGAVISADQLTEYYWNGNGPFMLQEQVAQFLGIKSFKRKYPGIMRRMLEMQERDFIRESGLASEHMCDLGLTAVNSADILDIMYSDFQEKYEEYCKHQRDRQAKELINKQKALSLAASQEKNKADITEQAVQSAAQWNASFNKTRKEQRKACMDLQTLTVHYPKGKMKQINKPKVGNYPVSLVPGQFTDYYKEFTPTEINNLPLSTMCYNEINIIPPEESEDSASDGSDSDSDSSSSTSGSCSSSSGVEDCKLCKHSPKKGSSISEIPTVRLEYGPPCTLQTRATDLALQAGMF